MEAGTWVESYVIPWGNRGIRRTARKMRGLVNRSLFSPLLVEAAGRIVTGSIDPADKARRIRGFLARCVEFSFDPVGLELIRSPEYMLRKIEGEGRARGDCDDVATLAAAIGKAAGLPARFVLVTFLPGGTFSHVFTELYLSPGWAEMDTTAPAQFPEGLRIEDSETHEV